MISAYYILATGIICGTCGYAMKPDEEANRTQKPYVLGGYHPKFYCYYDPDCPQHGIRIPINPIRVEVPSV